MYVKWHLRCFVMVHPATDSNCSYWLYTYAAQVQTKRERDRDYIVFLHQNLREQAFKKAIAKS
jgi:hypothetical protein